ncbi:hypothetical protein CCMSSC00406_0008476 [Pleurotus cornucopiae]|uniref:Uncharacterized protein n=1 Tax=Pleurotus cornucopiae TaxID=5321 RepID=A0ACB7IIF1_PLECO|nr:hypothetical protein CCMSSC00406_0008476 [Pleurotus cornucopiae]
MAKSVTSAKPKPGKQKKARGRKSWAKESKLEFLESFKEEYLPIADMKGLYTKITTQFIDKYGYNLPHDEDASDMPPIIVNLVSLPYDEQETEQEQCDEIYDSLRPAKYEDETEEFRKALEVRANTEYTQALDEYNKCDTLNGSPEAYAHA